MPSGRRWPPVAPAESAMGRTGSTQGESAVEAPAMNPKRISSAIRSTFPARDYAEMTDSARARAETSAAGGRGGDRSLRSAGDLRGATERFADPEMGADRQLVLASQ